MMSLTGRSSGRKGQTLIIAIMVMFILAIVAAVFVAMVARNLFRSERYSHTDSVAQIAEAGVRYADEMLTTSEDGADWRPIPDDLGAATPGNTVTGVQPTPLTTNVFSATQPDWEYLRDQHPDFKWTRPYWPTELPAGSAPGMGYAGPTGGYTTFHTGGGRFLLRVSYEPDSDDALSKYIKIESIGRWGTIERDPDHPDDPSRFDPTTLKSAGNFQLRREITAYKPIGLTDYLRFITNKDSRPMDFPLGVPGYSDIKFGRSSNSKYGARGGPIRVNGNLTWYGEYGSSAPSPSISIFLRGVQAGDVTGGSTQVLPVDKVEVAGDIKVDGRPGSGGDVVEVVLNQLIRPAGGGAYAINSSAVQPSDSPAFTTLQGFYRDGRDSTDTDNMARGIKRIEPPMVDQADPTNTTTRYRLLTLNSGERVKRGNRWINQGQYGWGRGVYIGNTRDTQNESETLTGGYTLRTDWIKPNNPMSTYWVGPYYVPPGCIITLHPGDTDGDGQPDFSITRTDAANSRGMKALWYDADGRARPEWGSTVTMPYPDPVKGRVLTQRLGANNKHIEGNGVIYAEGNIRIRGMLPKDMQLTVASNENIYIEGNLLKYRDPSKQVSDTDPYRGTGDDTNSCGLALLARKNVCVNTTQFFAPANTISADDVGSDAGNGSPPYHVVISNDPDSQFRAVFDFGPFESETGANVSPKRLLMRHSGQYGPSYINMWLNPSSSLPDYGILKPNTAFAGLPEHVWGVGDPNFGSGGFGIGSSFWGNVFPLDNAMNAHFDSGGITPTVGIANFLQIGLDQTTYTRNNYELGGLAIQPMDIRIEAIIYAQEGSFFIIPGNWFNPNPADFEGANARPAGLNPEFPLFGQALDVRIIIDGSVTENIPAAVSDVEEWMSKWGRIPEFYGSSSEKTAHPGEGLTFLYDDHVGWPLRDLNNPGTPIRYDAFGRALPLAPKLPVSGSLIYSGDVM